MLIKGKTLDSKANLRNYNLRLPFYLLDNPDVYDSELDPKEHFYTYGIQEGRVGDPFDHLFFEKFSYLKFEETAGIVWIDRLIVPQFWRLGRRVKSYHIIFAKNFKFISLYDLKEPYLKIAADIYLKKDTALFTNIKYKEKTEGFKIFDTNSIRFIIENSNSISSLWCAINKGHLRTLIKEQL